MIYTLFTDCPVKGVHISYPLAFLYIIIYEPLTLQDREHLQFHQRHHRDIRHQLLLVQLLYHNHK